MSTQSTINLVKTVSGEYHSNLFTCPLYGSIATINLIQVDTKSWKVSITYRNSALGVKTVTLLEGLSFQQGKKHANKLTFLFQSDNIYLSPYALEYRDILLTLPNLPYRLQWELKNL